MNKFKLYQLILVVLLCLYSIMSCSTGDSSNSTTSQDVLIKKIISSEGWSETFSYDGNKLIKIAFDDGTSRLVTYSGNYIIKSEIRDASNTFRGEYQTFSYLNNRISQQKNYFNNIITSQEDYVYNSDATIITCTIKNYNSNGVISSTLITKYYIDLNGSLVKKEQEGLGAFGITVTTTIFTYDTKNGIFKNILGYSVIPSVIMGKFNLISETSPNINIANSYQYNNQNYPISSTETTRVGNSNSNRVVSYQYLY